MFYLNGKYTSTIQVNGVNKIISRIGDNRVFYHCVTRRFEKIGMDNVIYDDQIGCIAQIGILTVLYDAETGRMSSIGNIPVRYDEQTGCIVSIGNSPVFYVDAPKQYDPVEEGYYSPLNADLEPQESKNTLQPIGLSFESANRERMAEFIRDLSNPDSRKSALFKIATNLSEEQEESAKNQHFSDGYCSEALKIGAIKKIAELLPETAPYIRSRAQVALLSLSKTVQDEQRPEFVRQISDEATVIINSMMTVLSQNDRAILEHEITNALELFDMLSFSEQAIQGLIMEKKVIVLLIKKRNDGFDCTDLINQILEKIIQINPAFKNAVLRAARAEILAQNPLPFTGLQLKNYYISHSTCSLQGGMFKDIGNDPTKLDTLFETLQKRAEKKSGNASEQTLNHFILGKG